MKKKQENLTKNLLKKVKKLFILDKIKNKSLELDKRAEIEIQDNTDLIFSFFWQARF